MSLRASIRVPILPPLDENQSCFFLYPLCFLLQRQDHIFSVLEFESPRYYPCRLISYLIPLKFVILLRSIIMLADNSQSGWRGDPKKIFQGYDNILLEIGPARTLYNEQRLRSSRSSAELKISGTRMISQLPDQCAFWHLAGTVRYVTIPEAQYFTRYGTLQNSGLKNTAVRYTKTWKITTVWCGKVQETWGILRYISGQYHTVHAAHLTVAHTIRTGFLSVWFVRAHAAPKCTKRTAQHEIWALGFRTAQLLFRFNIYIHVWDRSGTNRWPFLNEQAFKDYYCYCHPRWCP